MITSIELQVISKILTTENQSEQEQLCEYDASYYSVFRPQIQYILSHYEKYNTIPDVFTFQTEFTDIVLVRVDEPISYLVSELVKNKEHIILTEMFNRIKDLGVENVSEAWEYISMQCEKVNMLDTSQPLDIVKDAKKRSEQVKNFSNQSRIPTGFAEIDKVMYGGFSTVEELVVCVARTNTGKSWVGTKMMESAQKNGFPVLYYSPEMQASFLGTRFDTWKGNFPNSQIHQGNYTEQYLEYIKKLSEDKTSAYILEDKDAPDEAVTVPYLQKFIKKTGVKLLIIDGLSYMTDVKKSDKDYVKYKNLCSDLFKLSKQCGCAVVVFMQANRESRDNIDDKGEVFPNIYNIEGSDHPARIATQVFAMRQIFDKHVLDIRLEKSRSASNQKPVFSYAWDINTGNMQYLPSSNDAPASQPITPIINPVGIVNAGNSPMQNPVFSDDDEDIEF